MSDSLLPCGVQPTRLLCPWDFPGKNTGADCHFLLQGIFPTQGSNPGLPHCRQTLYHLSHQGSLHWLSLHYSGYIVGLSSNIMPRTLDGTCSSCVETETQVIQYLVSSRIGITAQIFLKLQPEMFHSAIPPSWK